MGDVIVESAHHVFFAYFLKLKIYSLGLNCFDMSFSSFACYFAGMVEAEQCFIVVFELGVDFCSQYPDLELVILHDVINNEQGLMHCH